MGDEYLLSTVQENSYLTPEGTTQNTLDAFFQQKDGKKARVSFASTAHSYLLQPPPVVQEAMSGNYAFVHPSRRASITPTTTRVAASVTPSCTTTPAANLASGTNAVPINPQPQPQFTQVVSTLAGNSSSIPYAGPQRLPMPTSNQNPVGGGGNSGGG